MRDLDDLFAALAGSSFRHRFYLPARERAYLEARGMTTIMAHGADFIDKRLAPAQPPNDGRQTPFRNHPVFIAQHATAACCRGCLQKWHYLARGHALADNEKRHVLGAIERWLDAQIE